MQHRIEGGETNEKTTCAKPRVRCRQITEADIEPAAQLLAKGFPGRNRQFWLRALNRLRLHASPAGFPKFGYVLECDKMPVGIILLIFSSLPGPPTPSVRCNISSWYVDPEFRAYSSLLVFSALKHKEATFINVSAAPHTRRTVEAQGFARYSNGQFIAFPFLKARSPAVRVVDIATAPRPDDPALATEHALVAQHAALGCWGLWCTQGERAYPFAFLPRRVGRGVIPVLQLIYCRDVADFVRFAGPIGRHLARRGRPFVLLDALGSIPGLPGMYFEGSGPKYFRGAVAPRLGDLAFTEGVLLGV